VAAAAEPTQAWGLDPNWGGDPSACGCRGCASCRSHAANKLFASAAAADSGRAHPFCRCLVVPLVRIEERVYNALFVDGGARPSVDRRYQWVQAVLAQGPAATLLQQSGTDQLTAPAAAVTARTVEAQLRRVWFERGASGNRLLCVELEAAEDVTATVAIRRNTTTLAHRAVTGVNGKWRLNVAIPADVKPGPARLRLRLRNYAGDSALVTRGVDIPLARAIDIPLAARTAGH
jgi:hypothetical protein